MPTFQLVTGKRTSKLGLVRYDVEVLPTPDGLVACHEAVVFPEGGQPEETREVVFSVPVCQQDDFDLIRKRWRSAIDQLKESYARVGLLVSMDIGIPMHVVRKAQEQVSDNLKAFVNEDSAPAEGLTV